MPMNPGRKAEPPPIPSNRTVFFRIVKPRWKIAADLRCLIFFCLFLQTGTGYGFWAGEPAGFSSRLVQAALERTAHLQSGGSPGPIPISTTGGCPICSGFSKEKAGF